MYYEHQNNVLTSRKEAEAEEQKDARAFGCNQS